MSDQHAQVLDAEVDIVVHVLVEGLIRLGVSRGGNRRLEHLPHLPSSAGLPSPSPVQCEAETSVTPVKPEFFTCQASGP